jgi:hypothetical protein
LVLVALIFRVVLLVRCQLMRKAIASCNLHIEFPARNRDVDAGIGTWDVAAAGHDRRMRRLEAMVSRNSTVGGSLHHVQSVLVGKKYSSYVEADDGARVGGARRHYLMAMAMEAFRSWACKAGPLSVQILFLPSFILMGNLCLWAPSS